MPKRRYPELLDALGRLNRELERYGVPPVCTVDDAIKDHLTDHRLRGVLSATEIQLEYVRHAMKGYLG